MACLVEAESLVSFTCVFSTISTTLNYMSYIIFLAALSSTNHDMDIPNNIYAIGLKLNTELLLKVTLEEYS